MLPLPLPSTSAYDVSGVVIEKGDDVSNIEIGDLVYSRVPQEQMGTLAEFVAVTREAVKKNLGIFHLKKQQAYPWQALRLFNL